MEPVDETPERFVPTSSSLDELREYEKKRDAYRKETEKAAMEYWQKESADSGLCGEAVHEGFSLISGSSRSSGTFYIDGSSGSTSVLSTTPGTGTVFIDYSSIPVAKASPYVASVPYAASVDPIDTPERWVDPMPKIKNSENARLENLEHHLKFQRETKLLTEEQFVEYADELENCKIALEAVDKTLGYYKDKKSEVEDRIKALETLFEVDTDDKYEGEVTPMTPAELKDMVDDVFFKSGISSSPVSLQSRLENAIDSYVLRRPHLGSLSMLKIIVSPGFVRMLASEVMKSGPHAATILTVGPNKITYKGVQLLRSADLSDTEIIVTEISYERNSSNNLNSY